MLPSLGVKNNQVKVQRLSRFIQKETAFGEGEKNINDI